MQEYEQYLREVEQASEKLGSIDAADLPALESAFQARGAAIERLSAALAASNHGELGEEVGWRIRDALSRGHYAMVRLLAVRQGLAADMSRAEAAANTLRRIGQTLPRQTEICEWRA